MSTEPQPKIFPAHEGRTYRLGRMTITFKTTAAETGGAYTLCEAIEPPDSGAGLHRHRSYDETFIICEGHYEFQLDAKMLKLGPGDTVFVPKGTPHGFRSVGPETGRQLIISSPGGIFDVFIDEVAAAMVDSGSPSKPGPATDFRAIAGKYGMEFLE
jgi:mannose-6-phosphate isomerase-like protein (cupin superfamily)